MTRHLFPAAILLLLALSLSAAADNPRLYPVDEAGQVPEFYLFRADLLRTVWAQDTDAVIALLTPDANLSFGGHNGPAAFRHLWCDAPGQSENLWQILEQTLLLGGTFVDGDARREFTAPYVHSTWPPAVDAYRSAAVTGADVRLRAQPSRTAPVRQRLDFDIVQYTGQEREAEGIRWCEIALADGTTGWVAARYLRHALAYRLGFIRTAAGWRIRFFVSGD